jgi:hypothetical protein
MNAPAIVPTIGRKVWFYDNTPDGCYDPEQAFDATVIYVWSPGLVNLRVTDHAGNTRVQTSVVLREPREGDSHGERQVATWMPYQMKVAATAAA